MPDNDLERHRSALRLLARAQLARHRQLGLAESDLVQQTFEEADRDVKQFRGRTDADASPGSARSCVLGDLYRALPSYPERQP